MSSIQASAWFICFIYTHKLLYSAPSDNCPEAFVVRNSGPAIRNSLKERKERKREMGPGVKARPQMEASPGQGPNHRESTFLSIGSMGRRNKEKTLLKRINRAIESPYHQQS